MGTVGSKTLSTGTPYRQHQNPLRFKQNEIIEGKVLKTLTSGRVLLLIKGREVMAKTPIPLQEGRTLSLITESPSPVPTFKPLMSPSPVASSANVPLLLAGIKDNIWESIFHHIIQSPDSGTYASALHSLLNQMGLQHFSEITPEFLRKIIDLCGWGWEGKLKKAVRHGSLSKKDLDGLLRGDIKGLSAKLLGLEKGDKQIEKLLDIIKSFQLINGTDNDPGKRIFVPLPIQYPEGVFSLVQIFIRLPETYKEDANHTTYGKDPLSITVQLNLSRLGSIRAGILLKGKTLEGKFIMEKAETKSLIEEHLPVLKERLLEKGFRISDILCILSDPDVFQQPLFMEMVQEDNVTLNMVV